MPELPEIETIKRGVECLTGNTIVNLTIRNHSLRYKISHTLYDDIVGKMVVSITRRAKYLVLELTSGFIIIHLGMSGRLTLITDKDIELKKHDHFDIIFNEHILRYNDPRRFGLIVYTEHLDTHNLIHHLGPEPLEKDFTATYLMTKLHNKKSSIKQLVMDNQIVVGVGNIYACESLFMAKILPTRTGMSIKADEAKLLVKSIKQVLKHAIELGGSTLRDYQTADGNLGYFQNVHQVYGKAGKACTKCGSLILDIRLGQRNSFYCPKCQK
jgi:formamidopyrimidine-DNA glycosylase